MAINEFEQYLQKANNSAQQESWQDTCDWLTKAALINPKDAGVVTGLGTCLVKMGKFKDAIAYFKKATILAPKSAEAMSNFGFIQVQLGKFDRAESAYRNALKLDPNHIPSLKNLAFLCVRKPDHLAEGILILASLFQTNPNDIEITLLLAYYYRAGGNNESARFLYQHVLNIQPQNAEALESIQTLPETKVAEIKDVSRIARPEHAKKLAGLKALMSKPTSGDVNILNTDPVLVPSGTEPATTKTDNKIGVAFYGTGKLSDPIRLGLPASALKQVGYQINENKPFSIEDLDNFDIFVFGNPQLSPDLLKRISQCSNAGKKIIIDVDEYFSRIPVDHIGYSIFGNGNPASIQALENSMRLADCVTVPTIQLAEAYRRFARQIKIIPIGWNQGNPLWDQLTTPHKSVKIGWCGSQAHQKDIAMIKNDLVRILKELPETRLVIGGEYSIYESFGSVSENKRLYLPSAQYEDYPYMLSQFDILLAPMVDDDFNQAKSDIKMVEAGVRRIPWVASPMLNYQGWASGGLFADKSGDWFKVIKTLVQDANLRQELGEAGRKKAMERESQNIASYWENVFSEIRSS